MEYKNIVNLLENVIYILETIELKDLEKNEKLSRCKGNLEALISILYMEKL